MAAETWTAVDEYVAGLLAPHDEALELALRASEEAGLPAIQVSPPQGKLLYLLAKSIGAGRSSSSAPSAATARSGWVGRWPPAAA